MGTISRSSVSLILPLLTLCCFSTLFNPASGLELMVPKETAEFLTVPLHEFLTSLQTALELVSNANSTAHSLAFGAYGQSSSGLSSSKIVVSNCRDLLALSSDVLEWSLSAAGQYPNEYYIGTGDIRSDLRAWLSSALTLHGTCLEEYQSSEADSQELLKQFQSVISRSSSLISDLLDKVSPTTDTRSGQVSRMKGDMFPSWFNHDEEVLLAGLSHLIPDVIVAKDGTGNYSTITEAIKAAPSRSLHRYVILVKKGMYKEKVEIEKNHWNIMMVGQGMSATIVSWNQRYKPPVFKTYHTATFGVSGMGFIACHMTFENTAGPEGDQAVALRSDSDQSVFFRCGFRGYQDTLYAYTLRQFYRECQISGTIDFIFGMADAVFQKCEILVRKGKPNQFRNVITANGREDKAKDGSFSFQFCNISADSSLLPYVKSTTTYLGRPWKRFSTTVFMQSHISGIIDPQGWAPWNESNIYLDTLYYAEYGNTGPGARTEHRVNWPGYHLISSDEASNFTVAQLIQGDLWLPSTGVPYTSGLVP